MRDTSTLFTYDPRVVQIPSNRISQPILACSPLPTNYTKYQNRPTRAEPYLDRESAAGRAKSSSLA